MPFQSTPLPPLAAVVVVVAAVCCCCCCCLLLLLLQAFASKGFEAASIRREYADHVRRRQQRAFDVTNTTVTITYAPSHTLMHIHIIIPSHSLTRYHPPPSHLVQTVAFGKGKTFLLPPSYPLSYPPSPPYPLTRYQRTHTPYRPLHSARARPFSRVWTGSQRPKRPPCSYG